MKILTLAVLLVHGWYPHECCEDEHCYQVQYVRTVHGDTVVRTEDNVEITIPAGFPHRTSEDGEYHLCFDKAALRLYHELRLFCFFIPGQA